MALPDIFAQTLEQILGYGIGGAVTPVVEWAARPIAYEVNAAEPNMVLDPATLAIVTVRRHGAGFDGSADAAKSGINGARFAELVDSVRTPLDSGSVIELLRRRKLSKEQAATNLARAGLQDEWVELFLALADVLITPSDLAMARQQGFVNEQEATARSELQGVSAADANLLYELSGLPPGVDSALELLARGEIDEAMFAQMVREGHTKTKYTADLLKLRWQPLSASVAAEALIRERISEEQAVRIGEENRIKRDDFLLWSNMMGRPMGIGQALTLVRRGEMNAERFREVVARSDVRTEFTDDLLKLKRVIPPLFQLSRLIAGGTITDELATKYIIEEGYDAELAHAIVTGAHKTKASSTHKLTAAIIDELYNSGLENQQWAMQALKDYGYSEADAALHLELLDARRLLDALQSDLAVIHRSYITHKIPEEQAASEIDQLGVRAEVRDHLLDTWTNERNANIERLTNAQIGKALKLEIITRDDAITRWMQNGYPQADAEVLAALADHPSNVRAPVPA